MCKFNQLFYQFHRIPIMSYQPTTVCMMLSWLPPLKTCHPVAMGKTMMHTTSNFCAPSFMQGFAFYWTSISPFATDRLSFAHRSTQICWFWPPYDNLLVEGSTPRWTTLHIDPLHWIAPLTPPVPMQLFAPIAEAIPHHWARFEKSEVSLCDLRSWNSGILAVLDLCIWLALNLLLLFGFLSL